MTSKHTRVTCHLLGTFSPNGDPHDMVISADSGLVDFCGCRLMNATGPTTKQNVESAVPALSAVLSSSPTQQISADTLTNLVFDTTPEWTVAAGLSVEPLGQIRVADAGAYSVSVAVELASPTGLPVVGDDHRLVAVNVDGALTAATYGRVHYRAANDASSCMTTTCVLDLAANQFFGVVVEHNVTGETVEVLSCRATVHRLPVLAAV